ncbi:MAG: deoxyribodipyrimidine photo-lyase [Pseudomonadota bacterium]
MTALVWFRCDLRIGDNPALQAAVDSGRPVIAVYIHQPDADWAYGGASRVWLHESLRNLRESLLNYGIPMMFKVGNPERELPTLCRALEISDLYWNREYDPNAKQESATIKSNLKGVECHSYNARLLVEPFNFANKSGEPYRVFTPFWKEVYRAAHGFSARDIDAKWHQSSPEIPSSSLEDLALLSGHAWEAKIRSHWQIGEEAALRAVDAFSDANIYGYEEGRNFPAETATSRLSPHLHFGEISVRVLWQQLRQRVNSDGKAGGEDAVIAWLRQLAWREFAHHLLYHFPQTVAQPLNEKFARMDWSAAPELLRKWQLGQTGYPLVDAGMRELWETGWMHNRVRMVVASFLTKHLGCHWIEGAKWFWDTLVDADLANNTLGWQWVAGCGADAAPYYRISNPYLQSQKFDERGAYIRRWIPALTKVPDKQLHAPLSGDLLTETAVAYPAACVDHAVARQAALDRYTAIKS